MLINLSISRRQCVQNYFLHSSNGYTMRYGNIIKNEGTLLAVRTCISFREEILSDLWIYHCKI